MKVRKGRRVTATKALAVALALSNLLVGVFAYFYLRQKPPAPILMATSAAKLVLNIPPSFQRNVVGPPSSPLSKPLGVTVDDNGMIYVADTMNNRIQVFTSRGEWVRRFGRLGAGAADLDMPVGLAVRDRKLYVADFRNRRVQVFSAPAGEYLGQLGGSGEEGGPPFAPYGLHAGQDGNLYVTTAGNRVLIFDRHDRLVQVFGRAGADVGELSYPHALAVDSKGRIWVADSNNARVQVFDRDGRPLLGITGFFVVPRGIAIDKHDRVHVADPIQQKIYVFDDQGKLLFEFGQRGLGDGELNFPNGLAIDAGGHELYVTDRENDRVVVFSYARF